MYKVERKQAAEFLNVSVRTIDRYIQKGLLSKQEINGRILINEDELKNLQVRKGFQNEYDYQFPKPIETTVYHETKLHNEDQEVYKNLYTEVQDELKEKRKQLEGANYRVGQLESLLKESVPLMEHKKVLALSESNQQTLEAKKTELTQLEKRLKDERLNKKIYLIILVILLLLQPLWLLYPLANQ